MGRAPTKLVGTTHRSSRADHVASAVTGTSAGVVCPVFLVRKWQNHAQDLHIYYGTNERAITRCGHAILKARHTYVRCIPGIFLSAAVAVVAGRRCLADFLEYCCVAEAADISKILKTDTSLPLADGCCNLCRPKAQFVGVDTYL